MNDGGAVYLAQMLHAYWMKGVDFGHGYENGKIDPAALLAEAKKIAEQIHAMGAR